ncbi:hypothetical protein BJ742DRAFT_159442 [Cladochytrium replicatum]|nr:hypothetical protein BJ742DRAFT_159442 [Cladochytrium replicatum]
MLHSKQQKKEDSQNESTAIAEHAARVMDPETSSNHGFQAKVEIGRSLEQPRRKSVRIIDEVQYIPISEEAPPPSLATRLESDDFVGDDSLYPMELSGDEDILLDEPSTSQDLIFDEEPPQFFGTPIRDGYDSLSPFIMSNHDDETHSENVAGEYVSPFIVPNPGSENACGDDAEVEDGNSVAGNVAEHQEPSESVSPPTSRRGYTFNIEKNDLSIGLLELGTDDEADHDDGYPAVDLGDQSADDILDLANMGTFLEEGSSLFIDKMSMLLEDGVEVEEIEEADGEGDFTLESILKDDEAAENENQSEAAEDKEFRNEAEDDKENQIGTESVETAFGGATPRRSILTSSNPLTARKTGILMTPYKAALLNSAAKAEATRAVKGFQMVGPQAAQTPVRHGQSPLADPFADPAQNQNSSNSALRETQVHNTALTPTRRSALRKSDPNLIPMTPAQSIPPTPQLISFSVARPVARNSVPSDAIAQRRAAKAALALWEGSDPERVEDSVLVTTENPDLSLIFLKSYIEGGMGDGNQDEGDDEDEDVELDLPLFGKAIIHWIRVNSHVELCHRWKPKRRSN